MRVIERKYGVGKSVQCSVLLKKNLFINEIIMQIKSLSRGFLFISIPLGLGQDLRERSRTFHAKVNFWFSSGLRTPRHSRRGAHVLLGMWKTPDSILSPEMGPSGSIWSWLEGAC